MYKELATLYGAIFGWSRENHGFKYNGSRWTLQVQCDPIRNGEMLHLGIVLYNKELQHKVVERKICSTTSDAIKCLDEFYEDLPFVLTAILKA